MKIKKAVIPVAGKGTRFLPATKQIAKEMLPILNVPMIDYVVDEAARSGIEELIFVTSSGKQEIENYFDRNLELESFLRERGKEEQCELIKRIGTKVEVVTVRQKEQLGLGHAILCAESAVGSDPFAVLLGDDLVIGENPATKQLIEVFKENKGSVIGVMDVPREDTNKYGIIDGKKVKEKLTRMSSMVEKPDPAASPSTLATPGRYIFTSEIFDYLKKIPRGAGGEYQLTDAINMMAKESPVFAYEFEGERFDTGNLFGHFEATLDFALRDKTNSLQYREIINKVLRKYEK